MENNSHRYFMKEALKEAEKAKDAGDVPVGAVLVHGEEIIARGHNKKEALQDATAHAEVIAIRDACRKINSWRLIDFDLYVTIEPCPMCLGAMLQSRVRRLIFGTPDPKSGAAGSVVDLTVCKGLNHSIEVISGVLEEDCRTVIQSFFKNKRNKT